MNNALSLSNNQWNNSKLHNYIRLQGEWTDHKTKGRVHMDDNAWQEG